MDMQRGCVGSGRGQRAVRARSSRTISAVPSASRAEETEEVPSGLRWLGERGQERATAKEVRLGFQRFLIRLLS